MVIDGNGDDSEDFNDIGNNDSEDCGGGGEDNMVTMMMIARSADPLTWGHGCKGSLDTFPPCH